MRIRFILAAAVLLVAVAPVDAQPIVQLSAWQPDASGTGVRFDALTTLPETDPVTMQDEIADGSFEYAIDTSQIKWVTDCSCFRYYVILVKSRDGGTVTRHKFRAYPSGSFDDQYAEVKMTIRSGARTGSAQIALPVASAPGLEPRSLLEVKRLQERPEPVSLGGTTRIRLTLRNATRRMLIVVPSDVVVRPETADLWTQTTASLKNPVPFSLPPDATETLTVDIQPITSRAIEASFVPIDTDKSHSSLHIEVPYTNPIFGNRLGTAQAVLPLRFRPSILTLLGALVAGVMLGSLVPLLASKGGRVTTWGRATATAVVVAIILELVGIFLVANNSKFVLFSFNLDPWQTLPVSLLGIANGLLGFEAAKKLKFIQDKKADD